jgi:hypothetical protein
MAKPATHLIIRYPSKSMDLLYRASDGMAMACRNALTVLAGSDPNPAKMTSRNFLDETFAFGYLKTLADLDANHISPEHERVALNPGELLAHAAVCEERNGESKLVKPSGQVISLAN